MGPGVQERTSLGGACGRNETERKERADGNAQEEIGEGGEPIDYPLNFKPFFLQTWVLLSAILINIGWIIWLAITISRPLWQGSEFTLGGIFSGYVATVTKFLLEQHVRAIGKIMPYRNMRHPSGCNVKNTIDSDYWPYEWPIPRFRALRNQDYFFQLVDVVQFVFASAIVQFESNILSAKYDTTSDYSPLSSPLLGYGPNRGVVIISIICHGVFILVTVGILVWLQRNQTGLLADPGCLALYLAMIKKDDWQEDFREFEDEGRPWIVRNRLAQNQYRIRYWQNDGGLAVYGIRKKVVTPASPEDARSPHLAPGRKYTEYPEFRYIPWFLKPFWTVIWTSVLAASLAILSTLVIHDSVIDSGFDPRVSTAITPFVNISPAAFLWSFFPSIVADLFLTLVRSIDIFYRLVQPYADMKRKNAGRKAIKLCFKINYINDLPVVVTIRALKNSHVKVALISLFALFAELTPAFAANMFYVSDDWIWVWTTYYWPVLVYLCLLIVFLLWTIPDRTRYMPRDLETIADHIALLSQSSLLDADKFQIPYKLDPPNQMSIPARITQWFTSATNDPGTFFKSILRDIKKALIGPSMLVEDIVEELEKLQPEMPGQEIDETEKLPRFGIWKRRNELGRNELGRNDSERNDFVVGIDGNKGNKMTSLFEDNYYELDFKEIGRSWLETIC